MGCCFPICMAVFMLQFTWGACRLTYNFNYFYFSQQWPASHYNSKHDRCYPTTGKPVADFIIKGLQPRRKHAPQLTMCDPNDNLVLDKISNLIPSLQEIWPSLDCPTDDGVELWKYKWKKYGTCSNFDQKKYFETSISLRNRLYILDVLEAAGIIPNGGYYKRTKIKRALKEAIGYTPLIISNEDVNGKPQLYQIIFCVQPTGDNLVDCAWKNGNQSWYKIMKFPSF